MNDETTDASDDPVIHVTHGFVCKGDATDAKRYFSINRWSDGNFTLEMETVWDNGMEPVVTRLRFTPAAMSLLTTALNEAALNLDAWERKEKS